MKLTLKNKMQGKLNIASFALLIVAFLIYSTTGIFTKLSSGEVFLSQRYILYFAFVLASIGIYAVLWQIILNKVPLTQAYLFKSITVLFSLFFAYYIFSEVVTKYNIVGAAFIVAGIIINSLH